MLGKKEKLWKIWKIVSTLVDVTNFSTTVVTIFPLDLAISFILLYETTITEKNEV